MSYGFYEMLTFSAKKEDWRKERKAGENKGRLEERKEEWGKERKNGRKKGRMEERKEE